VSEDRIQKILARAGVTSRRKAEELISEGRVTVNGRVATLGDKADPDEDHIKVDGKRVQPQRTYHYLLLNKPRAVMSTRHDPEGRPTVMDFVPPAYRKALVPVGRLDFLTEGLLLLTDDGDLAHRVAHPRYGCTKTYEVKVKGQPPEKDLDKLRHGFVLHGRRLAPADIESRPLDTDSDNSWWTVQLNEGRTRQVREMFERIGHPVMKLRRVAIGPLRDGNLPLGGVRELSDKEVETLRRSTRGGGKGGAKVGRGGGGAKRSGSKRAVAKGGGPKGGGPKGGGPKGAGPKRSRPKGSGLSRRGSAGGGAPSGSRGPKSGSQR
jgi:23S rRNA pseudouridine2605 synthase